MRSRITAFIIFLITSNLFLTPIEAREGGGGRGGSGSGRSGGERSATRGGEGGAYRGGNTMNRTPTMSRTSPNRNISQPRQGSQTGQALSQGRMQQSQQRFQQQPQQRFQQQPQQRFQQQPSVANRDQLRNQVQKYAQGTQNKPQTIDRQALAQKAQNFSSQRGNQIAQNRQLSNNLSQRLQQSQPNSKNWFNQDFFNRHNLGRDYAGTAANWWKPAAWGQLASWGGWNWGTPYYYDGGYAYPASNGNSTGTTTTSTPTGQSQTVQPQAVQSQPVQSTKTTTSAGDWLPLGVFAVANNADAAAQTNRFIQLAINRSGEIAGVLYNSATDAAQDLTGMVDSNNQKVYWTLNNKANSPIASTGLFNLTEDQTPINVHFADGSDQTWVLVRLQQ